MSYLKDKLWSLLPFVAVLAFVALLIFLVWLVRDENEQVSTTTTTAGTTSSGVGTTDGTSSTTSTGNGQYTTSTTYAVSTTGTSTVSTTGNTGTTLWWTNATSTTLRQEENPSGWRSEWPPFNQGLIINVQHFGAIPDDGLDDSRAFQNAIDFSAGEVTLDRVAPPNMPEIWREYYQWWEDCRNGLIDINGSIV